MLVIQLRLYSLFFVRFCFSSIPSLLKRMLKGAILGALFFAWHIPKNAILVALHRMDLG